MKNLDDFLNGDPAGQAEAPVEPSVAASTEPMGDPSPPEPVAAEPIVAEPAEAKAPDPGQVQADPKPEAKRPEQKPEEGVPPAPEDVTGLKSALQATRKERADYKGERDTLKGQLAALEAQLVAARAAAAAAPPPAPPPAPAPAAPRQDVAPQPIPNPIEDPENFAAYLQQRVDAQAWDRHCQMSEALFQSLNPGVDTKAIADRFAKQVDENPILGKQLRASPNPYKFAADHLAKVDAMAEIGPDPLAFRAKVEKELREKWEAEHAAAAEPATPSPAAAPAVVLPQSLGTVRSAAPRSVQTTGAAFVDFDDILKRAPRR